MPRGTQHDETGILLENGFYPKLQMADGGAWRVDITQRHRHLLGRPVRVVGIRAEFDLLEVQHISAI